jgi:hypothetical protein
VITATDAKIKLLRDAGEITVAKIRGIDTG